MGPTTGLINYKGPEIVLNGYTSEEQHKIKEAHNFYKTYIVEQAMTKFNAPNVPLYAEYPLKKLAADVLEDLVSEVNKLNDPLIQKHLDDVGISYVESVIIQNSPFEVYRTGDKVVCKLQELLK